MASIAPAQFDALTVKQDPVKPIKNTAVIVKEVHHSDSDDSGSVSSYSYSISYIVEHVRKLRCRVVQEIDDVDDKYIADITANSYHAFIAEERLYHLPKRGEAYDKILRSAEFFGVEICDFGDSIQAFVPESQEVAHAALAFCKILLELGYDHAPAIEKSFKIIHELGLLISHIIRTYDFKSANEASKEQLGSIYQSIVSFVAEVAIYYRVRINSMTTQPAKIDFFGTFGSTVDRIYEKKEHLANHMWAVKLRSKRYSLSIEEIRHKLKPVDQSGRGLLIERVAATQRRADGTCEWAQDELLDFLRSSDQMFTITGAPGSGKTTIANWMKDRFQKPINRRNYETISYTFPFDNRAEASSLACVKNLLSQLLERNVGDLNLFEALVKVFESFSSAQQLEESLWGALETGLKSLKGAKASMVVIVDGLDDIAGGDDKARAFHHRLHQAMNHTANTRAVTFSRPISNLTSSGVKHFVITKDQTHDDLRLFVKEALSHERQFKAQSPANQGKFLDSLVDKAKGSFLWTSVVLMALREEDDSQEAFQRIASSSSSDLTDTLTKFFGKIDFKSSTTKSIFALMLAAERPFTVTELSELLNVNVEKRAMFSERLDLRKHINAHCSYFVVERQGIVQFRHASIRKFLLDLAEKGKVLKTVKESNSELVNRMLLYARLHLVGTHEPSFDVLRMKTVYETFRSYTLMEYVVRNWLVHFRRSSMYTEKGELNVSTHLHGIFPDSVFFVMLERACWHHETSISEVIHHHDLALRIRIGCFGEKHVSVLQSMIIVGSLYREISKHIEAANFFYQASCIGQSILTKFSSVVVSCTKFFLTCTETITITTKTTIVTRRVEMIRFMIEICRAKHGEFSDAVIHWHKVLAELYVALKETHKAHETYKELHIIVCHRHGKGSKEAKDAAGLIIVFRPSDPSPGVGGYVETIFVSDEEKELVEEFEIIDERRITLIIKLALQYERSGDFFLAEQLFVNFWMRISEFCRIHHSIEAHIAKMTIAIAYVKFLQKIKRTEEASNILICLWAEYEHHKFESELVILKIKEIGVLFRSFRLLEMAMSVFGKVWGWFKGKGKHDHEEARSVTVLITEVVEEWIEVRVDQTITTEVTITEEIIREVFETTITRCRHSKVDTSFFKSCLTLINLYISQKKWSEVEVVVKRTLEISWKALLTVETELTISKEFTKEIIVLATKLAICYREQGHFHKAEEIYLRIYRACIRTLHCESVLVTETYMALINFYEEHHRHEKAIEIYIEVLGHFRKHLGHSHKLTIEIMYAIGSLSVKYGREDAYSWYIEIVRVLNVSSGHCHHDAFKACVILTKYYYEVKRWTELQTICSVLWKTFVHHHHEFSFTTEIIQTLYERYTYVLEFHAKVEFSVLYKLTVEYCETVTKFAGVTAEIVCTNSPENSDSANQNQVTIAMLALAKICETREEHWQESVTIYKEVIKTIRTRNVNKITETTITTVRKRLSRMQVKVITSGGSCDAGTVDEAIELCLEVYAELKIKFGCWHETTLTKLKELIMLYKKVQRHTQIISILQTSVIEIITKVTTSITLYHAAVTMASIYVAAGQIEVGKKLLYQLRHLIVLRDMGVNAEITIGLGGAKVGKVAYVFIATFEMGLSVNTKLSFSEIMADIFTETVLIEQYTRTVTKTVKIEVLLQYGAQLRCFWHQKGRRDAIDALDEKLFASFLSHFGAHIKTKREVTKTFYIALLTELGTHTTTKVDFAHLATIISTKKVQALLENQEFQSAVDVASCAFHFLSTQGFYKSKHGLSHGYRLAALLAGCYGNVPTPSHEGLRKQLLELSREVLTHVLSTARSAGISFASLKFEDVNGLVGLLGAQKNYAELESLLATLWQTRESHNHFVGCTPSATSVGTALVHVRYALGKATEAIELAETIAYNLRRSKGPLDPEALAAGRLLTALYTSSGMYRKAMGFHEEVLRELDNSGEVGNKAHVAVAKEEVELLKRAFARNKGWSGNEKRYGKVVHRMERLGVDEDVTKWKCSGGEDAFGRFKVMEQWVLVLGVKDPAGEKKRDHRKRASGLWYAVSQRVH